jgi:hypothetical protein
MKNAKIVQIKKAEKQITVMVGDKSRMNREYAADGIDAVEQKKLNDLGRKINKLKDIVAKLRAEIEKNEMIWQGHRSDYRTVQSQLDDVSAWGHADAEKQKNEVKLISDAEGDDRWANATTNLDKAKASMGPVWDDYLLQKATKAEYDPLNTDFNTRFGAAQAAEPQTQAISGPLDQIANNLGAIDAFVKALNYVSALELLKIAMGELETAEAAIILVQEQMVVFDTQWGALAQRLKEAKVCKFPDLLKMQNEFLAAADRIEADAADYDYVAATPLIADLGVMLAAYMAAYAKVVDEKTLYGARLPGISELTDALVSEFPALADQQKVMDQIAKAMEKAATDGNYTKALLEMDKLVPLLDAYRVAYANAVLGQDFGLFYAQMEPRFGSAAVCNFGPLEELSLEIAGDQQAAAIAGSAGKYANGIKTLNNAVKKFDKYDAKLAKFEQAEIDYDAQLAGVLTRFDAIAQCEYTELDTDSQAILALRESMETSATSGHYPAALAILIELRKKIGVIETVLLELDTARAEYVTRLPALISRFDGSMQSDYVELEDERTDLQKLRTKMEAKATATNYIQALVGMDAVERMLNDLDAQLGILINLQNQYLATYEAIKAGLAKVVACTHPELAIKLKPILVLRKEMLAAAETTDFATALEKAKELIKPIEEFAQLEILLIEYTRRLGAVTPRIATAMAGKKYLSLNDDKKAITDLHEEMTALAAKAELRVALDKMTDLEKLVTDILALKLALMVEEGVYIKLRDNMEPKIEVVKKNNIEKAQKAAKAVTKAHDEMIILGKKHEFFEAVPKADEVDGLIAKYLEKVDEFGDDEAAYDILGGLALVAYTGAEQKSKEYKDHKDLIELFGELTSLKKAMLASAKDKNFKDAIVQAKSLLNEAGKFDDIWELLIKREAAITAAADAAISRLNKLTAEDKKKAKDDYDEAAIYKGHLETAISEKKFGAAEIALKSLLSKLDDIGEALKTTDEHKAKYEGHRDSLQPRVVKANKPRADGSDFRKKLKVELDKVNDAFDAMTKMAGREDYKGAVDKADDVVSALTAFDAKEDKEEQKLVRFKELLDGIKGPYNRAMKALRKHPSLISRADMLMGMLNEAVELAKKGELDEAIAMGRALRDKLNETLDQADVLTEKAEEEEEEEEEDDEGWTDLVGDGVSWVGGQLDDAVDYGLDKVGDLGEVITEIPEAVSELIAGDYGPVGEFIENTVQLGIEYGVDPAFDQVGGRIKDGAELAQDAKDITIHVVKGEYEEVAEIAVDAVKDKIIEPLTKVVDDLKKAKDEAVDFYDKIKEIRNAKD